MYVVNSKAIKGFFGLAVLLVAMNLPSCKSKDRSSNLDFDDKVDKILSGMSLGKQRLKEVCSTSLKIFIANAEKFRHLPWEVDTKSFEKSVLEGRNDFIAAHSKRPKDLSKRCNPRDNPITYILSIYDGGSAKPDSQISLHTFSYINGEWGEKTSPASPINFSFDHQSRKLTNHKGEFELNMATDVVDIIRHALAVHVPSYDQVQLYINGHGGRALSASSKVNDQVNLFNNHDGAPSENLILFDTRGPQGEKLTSELWAPVWKKDTVRKICGDEANKSLAAQSIVCKTIDNDDSQIGGVSGESGDTSGDSGNTSGESGDTSGDSGNTSGKIFRFVKPKMDESKPASHTNPEGVAQAGAVASYTISKDLYNEFKIKKLNFYFPKAKKPGYVFLNSCYQSDKIASSISAESAVPFYLNYNPGPIYSWLVDYKILNDYKYRLLPHLLHWRDQLLKRKVARPKNSPEARIVFLANEIESHTKKGINGVERVKAHATAQCTINNNYCQLRVKSFVSQVLKKQ